MTYSEHLTAGLAIAWDCNTEEVPSRITTKRKRTSQTNGEIPWTAARCHRLLRTITSRISLLRKDLESGRLRTQGDGSASNESSQRRPAVSTSTTTSRGDPLWLPNAQPKPTLRAYGKAGQTKTAPPSIARSNPFATPFVKRLMRAPGTKSPASVPAVSQFPLAKRKQLPVQCRSSSEESLRNLVSAFGSLLVATNPESPPKRRGARSLMSTCLRKVPGYIAVEIASIDENEAEVEDVATSVYADLETLGTRDGGGWSGLREVVRAHAVQQVCEAIEGRLLPDDRTAQIFDLCREHGAIPEAFDITRSWLARQELRGGPTLRPSHPVLSKLAELDKMHGASRRVQLTLTDLIREGRLSASDTLESKLCGVDKLVSALIRGPGCYAAQHYLSDLVSQAWTSAAFDGIDPGQRLLEKVAGLLTSISLAWYNKDQTSTGPSISTLVHRIASEATSHQARCSVQPGPIPAAVRAFLRASLLLNIANVPVDQDLALVDTGNLMALLGCDSARSAAGRRSRSAFVFFACNVATHVARFADIAPSEAIARVTAGFEDLCNTMPSADRQALQEIEVDIAFEFAERTGTSISDIVMERIGGLSSPRAPSMNQVSMDGEMKAGFRWEEGLCEWIAATPLRKAVESAAGRYPTPLSDDQDFTAGRKSSVFPIPTDRTPKRRRYKVKEVSCSPDILAEKSANLKHSALPKRQSSYPSKALQRRSADGAAATKGTESVQLYERTTIETNTVSCEQAPKVLKRARSENVLAKENKRVLTGVPDDLADELGILSPARKRARPSAQHRATICTIPSDKPSKLLLTRSRLSLPVQVVSSGDMSDDELGS